MSTQMQLSEVDGVQFFTDNEGNVGLSQRGLAKLCGIHAANSKRDIEAIISKLTIIKNGAEMAESITIKGDETAASFTKIYNSNLCVKVIAYAAMELGKPLAKVAYNQLAELGFTKWVQSITGYQPEQPAAVSVNLTELEMAKRYVELLEAKANTQDFLSNKPGLANKMEPATQFTQKQLPAPKKTFDEMCEAEGISEYDAKTKRVLSRNFAQAIVNDLLVKPEKRQVIKRAAGSPKPQYYLVNVYPAECLPAFRNVIKMYQDEFVA